MKISSCSKVCLIPARGGSKRVPEKNIRELGGHPLIAYTIDAAKRSCLFKDIIVSTDSEAIADTARKYGAEVPFMRPKEFSGEMSADIEWVKYTLEKLSGAGRDYDAFALLRPTSPFRTVETIKRAWGMFLDADSVDSLRAVEKCGQHPCKMWVIRQNRMLPLIPFGPENQPWHSSPYQSLPEVYIQNASLEIAWSRVPIEASSIAGASVIPFITEEYEGFDINTMEDWVLAEQLIERGQVSLPVI